MIFGTGDLAAAALLMGLLLALAPVFIIAIIMLIPLCPKLAAFVILTLSAIVGYFWK